MLVVDQRPVKHSPPNYSTPLNTDTWTMEAFMYLLQSRDTNRHALRSGCAIISRRRRYRYSSNALLERLSNATTRCSLTAHRQPPGECAEEADDMKKSKAPVSITGTWPSQSNMKPVPMPLNICSLWWDLLSLPHSNIVQYLLFPLYIWLLQTSLMVLHVNPMLLCHNHLQNQ